MTMTDSNDTMSPVPKDSIRQVISEMLQKMGVPYKVTPFDEKLHDICVKRALDMGWPMGTDSAVVSLRPFIKGGVCVASTSYGHIKDEATLTYIAMNGALVLCVDDVYERDNEGVRMFVERFIRGEKQSQPILDSLATLLRETPDHFEPVASSIIVTGMLNLVNASTLEYQTRGMESSVDAHLYPAFSRRMSAAAESYALMIFPRHLPLQSYVQCIQEAADYFAYANDVLSFYKEDARGETTNYVSVLARCNGISKIAAFKQVANEVSNLDAQVCKILKGSQEALDAWNSFKAGYVYFHTSLDRYRLHEVMDVGENTMIHN